MGGQLSEPISPSAGEYHLNQIVFCGCTHRYHGELFESGYHLLLVLSIVDINCINLGNMEQLNMNFFCKLKIQIPLLPCLINSVKAI